MSKSLKEITDVLRQIIEGNVKQASIGDDEDDKTQPHKPGEFAKELLRENRETVPSGVASYDEEKERDADEDKEEESTEGAEMLLSGPSGYAGVPEPSDTPNDSPTSSPASVEKQSHIKQASTTEISEAALHYASRIYSFFKEASDDAGYLLSEASPSVLSRLVVDKVVEEARSRANVVGAILYSVKLAQDEEEAEYEEKENETEGENDKGDRPTDDSEDTELTEEGLLPPDARTNIPIEEVQKLLDAVADLARGEAGRSPEEEEEEPPPEEKVKEKGEILERLLAAAPAPAETAEEMEEGEKAPPEEIKNASDAEILSATLDALLARGETLADLAAKGGRTGYRLAKSAEAYLKSGRYTPYRRLPSEKRARARRLRDYVEDFISDLYNKSRN